MTREEEGLSGHELLAVDARRWWEETRAAILASPATDEQKRAGIEALGPAPAAGTTSACSAGPAVTIGVTPCATRPEDTSGVSCREVPVIATAATGADASRV